MDLIPAWSGSLERAGLCKGLSGYIGNSVLAGATGSTAQHGDGFAKDSNQKTLKSDAVIGADLDRVIAKALKAGATPTHVRALHSVGYKRVLEIQKRIGLAKTFDRRRRKGAPRSNQGQLW